MYQTDFTFNCEDEIIAKAIDILQSRVEVGVQITSPDTIKQYLTMTEPAPDVEVFRVVWLDNSHRVIKVEELARGTIDSAAVYPREVIKAALKANAAAAIISHNHPTTNVTPSKSDKTLTDKLRNAFGLLDIRLLDHIVTGKGKSFSMAEAGYI